MGARATGSQYRPIKYREYLMSQGPVKKMAERSGLLGIQASSKSKMVNNSSLMLNKAKQKDLLDWNALIGLMFCEKAMINIC